VKDALTDLSDATLTRAVEENDWELSRGIANLPDGEVHDDPGLLWHSTGIPIAFLNGVSRARFEPADADARIERALAAFRCRALPAQWTVGPASAPPDLGRRLLEHGLKLGETTPGMACDLATVQETASAASGIEVRPVLDESGVEDLHAATTAAFGSEPPVADGIRRWYRAIRCGRPDLVRSYVGYLNGEAAGGSTAFFGAGVVGLYGVGTAPEARHLGVGRAVSLAPLLEARERGYRAAVLTSSEMGISIYRRLGFREVCSLDRFVFSPSD